MSESKPGRDRVRELLDAVLAEYDDEGALNRMAEAAFSSTFHFARQVSRVANESPARLRRRVLLERAAWELQRSVTVTDAAFTAGYDSVDGFSRAFSRAFGCVPSEIPDMRERGHWLPAPNGIHFHSPTALYADSEQEQSAGDVVMLMIQHDLDDVDALLTAAKVIGDEEYRRERMPGHRVLSWSGDEASLADVLRHLVLAKLPWLASIQGEDEPDLDGPDDPDNLQSRHSEISAQWLAMTRDVERRRAWGDRMIDALCDPPESFQLSQIIAHVLTFSAHRRQVARWMLTQSGVDISHLDPDPIMWHRRFSGGNT
ncbi:MAG: AraC family transcriptional regulator [Leucobacter sp.]